MVDTSSESEAIVKKPDYSLWTLQMLNATIVVLISLLAGTNFTYLKRSFCLNIKIWKYLVLYYYKKWVIFLYPKLKFKDNIFVYISIRNTGIKVTF